MNRHASVNRVFRLIWSSARRALIPVAETARGRVKGASRPIAATLTRSVTLTQTKTTTVLQAIALILASCSAPTAFAQSLPQGGVVRAGSGTITSSATRMDVTTATSRTAIDWTSFSIGAGDEVDILQPSSASITVNRIVGADPSQVFGELLSNGQVVLANPNGIWFGPNARVDVAGIVATTNRLSDSDVAAFAGGGALNFDVSTSSPSIVNQGAITVAAGGLAGLVAPGVANSGTITARRGSVTLASGAATTIDFYGDGLINLVVSGTAAAPTTAVDGSPVKAAVANSGTIIADGGSVRLSANVASGVLSNVIDMSGVIEARGVTTTGGVVELLGGTGSVSVAGVVDVSGEGRQSGGSITVEAGTPAATQDGIVDIAGSLAAGSGSGAGGNIAISGRIVTPTGAISVNGASGGSVDIDAATLTQSGAISADATTGAGGRVNLAATSNIIQTTYASTTADSSSGSGGAITLDGGLAGRVFSSGLISANGASGGEITLLAGSIGLAAANLDASGASHGGQILVGGGLHGQGEPSAATTDINPSTTIAADALGSGDGGTVVIWSSSKTIFEGSASARGGSSGGNGGLIEVSSGDSLAFTGSGDAGAPHGRAGTLLLDPRNIVIDSDAGNVAQFSLIDPDAGLGTGFGTLVVQLSSGTVLVTKPGDTVGGAVGAGSIFFFNPTTGALLSAFQGSHAGDAVGSLGVTFLNYTNWYNYYYLGDALVNDTTKAYVISSPSWNNNAGAITWVAANSTISGILSSSNSLVGASAGDTVGAYNGYNNLFLLPNNNYLVLSPNWGNGKGAATFGTASATLTGVVSSSNSLVGSIANQNDMYNTLAGDNVGSGNLVMLANNNFVLLSPNWNAQAGAVTFGTETAGMATGVLSSSNSLVGATGSETYVAIDTLDGNLHSNAYYGGDQVGNYYNIYPLSNGSYVVASPNWDHDKGAVTIGNGTTGISGTISTANSLTGSTPGVGTGGQGTGTYNGSTYYTTEYGYRGDYGGDQLGSGGVTVLTNGNLVIASPTWDKADGAVTFLSSSITALGTSGSLANVTSANSLVGSHQSTISWDSAGDADFSGGDSIGSITALPNSNYVVASTSWNGTLGAVTLMDGSNGHVVVGSSGTTGQTVSASNSLVGSSAGDYVGSVTPLTGSSNFVVASPDWDNGKGEVTRVSGTAGLAGAVSSSNSLVGTTGYQADGYLGGDNVGSSIVTLANGNWIIVSPNWSMTKGAVTFELASVTPTGNISAGNSLVGATAGTIYCTTCNDGGAAIFGGDAVGSGGVTALPNNNFIVLSPQWNSNKGAATFVAGATGALVDGTPALIGTISSSNSLVGSNAGIVKISAYNDYGYSTVGLRYYVGGDQIGSYGALTILPNGNFVLTDSLWNAQAGAVTFGLSSGTFGGGAAFAGIVGSTNSLIGGTAGIATAPANPTSANWSVVGGDQVGSAGIQILASSNYLILSPQWSNTAGAVTWAGGSTAITGVVSSTNSLVGSTAGDMVGTSSAYNDVTVLPDGNYIIGSPGWNGNRGAVTFGTPGAPVIGVVSSANSLVGSTAGDEVGSGGVTALPNGDYVINSPSWNGGVGAATWSQGIGAVTGVISSTNSILGVDSGNNSLLSFASTDPKAFFVTLAADNGGEGGVILAGTDPTVWDFARAQANTVTIAPSLILSALNTGTSIVLEASNDITVSSAVVANPSATGAFTLDAGRSVLVHADINTGDGALTIIANDTAADGVINAERSSGTAVITVDSGATLSSGTAPLTIDLALSADKTYNTAGNITLGAVSGASVTVTNLGSASGDLTLNGIVSATDSGTSLLLVTGGDLINTAGSAVLNPGAGRYLVYSADPRTNTPDGLTDSSHFFGESYALNGPGTQAANGNIYLYSVIPVLTVTSNSSAGYGTSASALTAQISGFIDGDSLSSAVNGVASLATSYVAGDAVGGSYPITVGLGSLTSPLGYGFTFTNGNVVVTKEPLSIVLAGTVSKTYNANPTATLTAGNYMISGLYGSDSISVTKTAGSYASVDVGTLIDVSTTLASGNFSPVGGTLLSNYNLPTGSVSGLIGTITQAPLTATLLV
jgi:filamentous hemagglutinin family protein